MINSILMKGMNIMNDTTEKMKVLASGDGSNLASYLKLMKDVNHGMSILEKNTIKSKALAAANKPHADAKKKAKRKTAKKSRMTNRHK